MYESPGVAADPDEECMHGSPCVSAYLDEPFFAAMHMSLSENTLWGLGVLSHSPLPAFRPFGQTGWEHRSLSIAVVLVLPPAD